jgi:hypothetical protein
MAPNELDEHVTASAQVTNRVEFYSDGTRYAGEQLGCLFADIRPGTGSDPGIIRINIFAHPAALRTRGAPSAKRLRCVRRTNRSNGRLDEALGLDEAAGVRTWLRVVLKHIRAPVSSCQAGHSQSPFLPCHRLHGTELDPGSEPSSGL